MAHVFEDRCLFKSFLQDIDITRSLTGQETNKMIHLGVELGRDGIDFADEGKFVRLRFPDKNLLDGFDRLQIILKERDGGIKVDLLICILPQVEIPSEIVPHLL